MHEQPLSPEAKLPVSEWLDELGALDEKKDFESLEQKGWEALKSYPKNLKLWSKHAETAISRKDWDGAVKRLNRLLRLNREQQGKEAAVLRLADLYVRLGQPGEAELQVSAVIAVYPGSLILRRRVAELTTIRLGVSAAVAEWRALARSPDLSLAPREVLIDIISSCVAGLRLGGCREESNKLVETHYRPGDSDWANQLKDGLARTVAYDNGKTRLEFYTKIFEIVKGTVSEGTRLAVTFDNIGQTWGEEPFAYKALRHQKMDILAIRKNSIADFHQDFSTKEFLKVALPLARCYSGSLAFGHSLGGYCALYYASWIPDCRILVTAPRNPLNPKYSRECQGDHENFRHEYDMPVNPDCSPTIVYNPKNRYDETYTVQSLRVSFPRATFVKYPYCGHFIPSYLADVGILKTSTADFCAGAPFPEFDRRLRGTSKEYLGNLGHLNFAAGCERWALALASRSLETDRKIPAGHSPATTCGWRHLEPHHDIIMLGADPSSKESDVATKAVKKIRILHKAGNLAKAEKAGVLALDSCAATPSLLSVHACTAIRARRWFDAFRRLKLLLDALGDSPERDAVVLRFSSLLVSLGQPLEAEAHVEAGLAIRPGSLVLLKALAELKLLRPEGGDAFLWRTLAVAPGVSALEEESRLKLLAACIAGLRLAGCGEEAKALFETHYQPGNPAWASTLADGYSRLVVFDNGKTRIEYYAKLFSTVTSEPLERLLLAVTFDIMGPGWNKPPYGYKPMAEKNADILAVRKSGMDGFHQDMTRDDFLAVAAPVARRYANVIALGQSLGAYGVLYYATWLENCRVLATAPRNPLNPKHSVKRHSSFEKFRHEYEMPPNESATPTIVYDPKNREDGLYVENCLKVGFPNARFLKYPYCGHSITRYLLEIGLLKNITLGFCDGIPFPAFDRKLRGKSSEYLRNIAKLNFAVGRKRWALALLARALELGHYRELTESLLARIDPPPVVPEPPPKPPSPVARFKKWFARQVMRRVKKNKNSGGKPAAKRKEK